MIVFIVLFISCAVNRILSMHGVTPPLFMVKKTIVAPPTPQNRAAHDFSEGQARTGVRYFYKKKVAKYGGG